MMQITKRLNEIHKSHDTARQLAKQGKYEQSDDYYIEAYTNAVDLIESYTSGYFTDEEFEFLNLIIEEFEEHEEQ
jgi:hypothetical protein